MIKYRKRRKRGGVLKESDQRINKMEQKINKLEQRINHLEYIIKNTESSNVKKAIKVSTIGEPVIQKETIEPQEKSDGNIVAKKIDSKKFKEVIVGKYFIGALASLLIFIAAISLINLVWDSLTPGMKLGILILSGTALTVLGFTLIRKKKNPISSIILGTGAGLLFISILSANMYFKFIESTTAIILVGIWSGFFILSYKYTQVFFTSIIAYIGSYIAIILGLGLIAKSIDYIVLSLFATGVSALMVVTSYKWTNYNRQTLSVILSILSYSTLLLWGMTGKKSLGMSFLFYYRFLFTLILIVTYILLNYMYKLIDRDEKRLWSLIAGFLVTLLVTILTILYTDMPNSFFINRKRATFFFLTINLIQLILIEFRFNRIVQPLTKYYTITISLATLILISEMYISFIGLTLVVIILLIIEKIMKHNNYSKIIPIMLAIDLLLLATHSIYNPIFIYYGLLQVSVTSYILYIGYKTNKTKDIFRLKTISLFIYMVNSITIPSNIFHNFSLSTSTTIKYLSATIIIIILSNIGFFKEWSAKDFEIFGKNKNIPYDKTKYMFYIITTILYFRGISLISSDYYNHFIIILSTLALALTQTISLLKYNNKDKWLGFWIGIKYWILTWTSLISIFNLNVNSILLSVTGLMIALGSIAVGFKLKTKSLRLYGLMLTILMVLKFIIIDLSQENSITRIIALLIGGFICFGISVLYNKLNSIIEEDF